MAKVIVQKILLAVTNDLVTDHRVHKVSLSLQKMGYEVTLIGRQLNDHRVLNRPYKTHRMRLSFKKGPLFYAEFNLRLLQFIRSGKFDILVANDLDTLPAIITAARFGHQKVVFDSHELFTEVPELVNRPFTQKIWKWIEKCCVPRVDKAYTVCDSIAERLSAEYQKEFQVIRNIPRFNPISHIPFERQIDFGGQKVILYQGAVNLGRGLELMIDAMQHLPEFTLVIAGDGDKKNELTQYIEENALSSRIFFLGRLSISELQYLTPQADLGISLEEDRGLNYHFALPNKLFDYIHAGIPVLVSDLPEMRKIVEKYKVGEIVESRTPKTLADQIRRILENKDACIQWEENADLAARELCWQKEEKKLIEIYTPFLSSISHS